MGSRKSPRSTVAGEYRDDKLVELDGPNCGHSLLGCGTSGSDCILAQSPGWDKEEGKNFLYIVGSIQALVNVAEVVLIFKQCDPPVRLWDSRVPGTCNMISVCSKVGFAQGSMVESNPPVAMTDLTLVGIGAAADFFLAFYPIHIIGRLQKMKLSTKIGLCLIMGGGLM